MAPVRYWTRQWPRFDIGLGSGPGSMLGQAVAPFDAGLSSGPGSMLG